MSRENGTKFSSTTLCLSRISANVDTGRIISDNFGCADAALSIDKKLTRASSSATVPLFHVVCRIEGDVTICEEVPTGETAMVSASWTGAGNLEPTNEKFKFKSKNFMAKFDFKGEFRNATASGQVNGDDLGATSFANLFNSKSGQLFVCHGDC